MAISRTKRITRKLHLLLGLGSGLVVFVVSVTGCLWVFQAEFTAWLSPKPVVTARSVAPLTPTAAAEAAQRVFPEREIHGTVYAAPTEPLEVVFYEYEPEFYRSVYLDPYGGEVLGTYDHRGGFFGWVLDGHLHLWLPPAIGAPVTQYGTAVFVLMLISGIVLWWPKNKRNRKQRLRFDWRSTTRWRRKNFDLHGVVGFYASLLAFVIAFTGLMMAFDGVYVAAYEALGGSSVPRFVIPNNTSGSFDAESLAASAVPPLDRVLDELRPQYPPDATFEVHYPRTDTASIYVEIATTRGIHYAADYRFFDQSDLAEIDPESIYGTYAEASVADKAVRMSYDVHVGAIGGLLGKCLAFVVSLLCASLPVTGVLLWWGRRRKGRGGRTNRSEVERELATVSKLHA